MPGVPAQDGYFYGMGYHGGAQEDRGTVFRMDADGYFQVLHDFDVAPDGAEPLVPLMQAGDGNLYGVAQSESGGLVYRIAFGP